MTTSPKPSGSPATKAQKIHSYPVWSPRFWHGMRFGDWVKLLGENRFRVHPARLAMVCLISLITPFNTVMSRVQRLIFGRRVANTPLARPPLFIIGHWRSGTTLLHELLVLDDRFTYPTTYQCFAPLHFLLTEWFLARYCGFLLPKKRPMDNVKAGWQRPQEDEFALLTMGARTPYRRMAFPNNPNCDMEYLDMQGVADSDVERWREMLYSFAQTVTYRYPRRLVLKSPTHTGRVQILSDLFPGAQFVHMTRDPYTLFPSTMRLWKSLDAVQACQWAREDGLAEYVFESFERMYRGLESQRASLAPSQILDVRYEDLVADPVACLEDIYRQLELGDFEYVRPRLESYLKGQRGYQTNRYELTRERRDEVSRRWASYFERYGYEQ